VSPDLPRIFARTENQSRKSTLDDRTKIKLVCDALLNAQTDAFAGMLILQPTEENKLTQLASQEIVWALQTIQKSNGELFLIEQDLSAWLEGNAKPRTQAKVLEERFGPKWRGLFEKGTIVLMLKDRFSNWCEAERYKRSMTLANLSTISRGKVLATVTAIYERFELSADPKVTITWSPPNATENYEARKLSLDFLVNKEVVREYKFQAGGIHINVEIDVKEFFRLRDELLALYLPLDKETEAAGSSPAAPTAPKNAFSSIEGLQWQDLKVQFVDGHNVRISAKDVTEVVNYAHMGFEDLRTHLPNTQWSLLRIFASNKGQIDWENSDAADNVRKRKQVLSNTLREYFQIDDDPFYPYSGGRAYRIKFALKGEGD